MKTTIEITNGPSREELFDGLRLFTEKRLILFAVKSKSNKVERSIATVINSIETEDGSGQSWNLTFSIDKNFLSSDFFTEKVNLQKGGIYISKVFNFYEVRDMLEIDRINGGGPVLHAFKIRNARVVKAYYSTKTRKGTITVE